MKLGSLFDGSGGFPLAGALNGITPVWASEIEPYPIAVTRSRFPNMKHYGDIRTMNGAELEPVDIISFGSPCTDMSIAGKREGLSAERSGLFFQAIRIIQEMRRKTNGEYPKYIIWENVQGAFSSNKGHDFHAVLQEITATADGGIAIPKPFEYKRGLPTTKLRWSKAGEIMGDNFSIAWRTVDAQYWGVPQRRKRIYLVADFTGRGAREILFKQDSSRGNMQESTEQRQNDTGNAVRGIDGSAGELNQTPKLLTIRSGCEGGGKGPLIQDNKSATISCGNNQTLFVPNIYTAELEAMSRVGGHVDKNISSTIRATPGDNQTSVCYSLQVNGIDRSDNQGCNGKGWSDKNTSYTLSTADRHCVAFDHETYNSGANFARTPGINTDGTTSTLVAQGPSGVAYNYSTAKGGQIFGTLQASAGDKMWLGNQEIQSGDYHILGKLNEDSVLFENHSQDSRYTGPLNTAPTISAKYGTGGNNQPFIVSRKYIIRRLTPTECARLQGFPDWWGHLNPITEDDAEFWTAVYKADKLFNNKPYKPFKTFERLSRWHSKLHSDSNEYKMWGNGICLWNAEYIMRNIMEAKK